MVRVLVFLFAGWQLLLPPGMCICQFIRAAEAIPRSSEDLDAEPQNAEDQADDTCTEPCCVPEKAKLDLRGCQGQDEHLKPECPSNCPASGKGEHFKLVEHQHLSGVSLIALTPLPFFAGPQHGKAILTLPASLLPYLPPIYLSLCTLLI